MHVPPDREFQADEIFKVLARHHVDFVVIGGIAVQSHGYIRGTYDVDIIVRPSALNVTRLSEALMELEAELRAPGGLRLTDPHQLQSVPLVATVTKYGPLDVVHVEHVAGPPKSYETLRADSLVIALGDVEVPVAGLSDLIRMKRAAGRDQDLADIEALTREPQST